MKRLIPAVFGFLVLFSATIASAALPPAYYTNSQTQQGCTATAPCGTQGKVITFYVPHGGVNCASSVQGCIATSKPGLDGQSKPISVDAVRLHKAQYATCASDSSNYGKYFNMGTITYRSALDQQMYTVPNVICYVHDTGSAFQGRTDKLDLATTICATCTEAQAHAIGIGGQVNLVGQGAVDTNKNNSIFNAALANMGATPGAYTIGSGSGQVLTQDYYCMTSTNPIVVVPLQAGSTFPSSGCYNQPPTGATQQQASNPFSQAISRMTTPAPPTAQTPSSLPTQPPLGTQTGTTTSASVTQISPVALLVAQPKSIHRGDPVLVSWTSVGMDPQSVCQVSSSGHIVTQKNSGSQIVPTTASQVGTLTFTLSCTTQAGAQMQQSAAVSVN